MDPERISSKQDHRASGSASENTEHHRNCRRQMKDARHKVLDAVTEAFEGFVTYYRQNDSTLPKPRLFQFIREGIVTKEELCAEFKRLIDPTDKDYVLDEVTQVYNDFVFNDRKLDDSLTFDQLDVLLKEGRVSKAEIVAHFKQLVDNMSENT